ncbi:MAG: diguanylate cyclase, partial [Actinomycetes bacterium]
GEALEQSVLDLERLSSILNGAAETSDSPLLVFDDEEKLMTMNSAAIKLFGSARAAENGWSAHSLFSCNGLPAPTLEETFSASARLQGTTGLEPTALEWSVVTNSGAVVPASIVGSALAGQFGAATGWVLRCTPLISEETKTHEAISSERLAGQVNLLETRQAISMGVAQAGNYISASTSQREALQVIEQFLPKAFPSAEAQLLHIIRAERSHSVPLPEMMIGPSDCWSLRTRHSFQSGDSNRISCAHLRRDAHSICVPLTDGHDQVAVITLDLNTTKIALPDFAITALLEEASNSFSTSLINLRLRRSLEEQAYLDPLTQVGNRRVAEDSIATGIARLRSVGEEFAIVMVDIDHFKVVNDRFGHEAGDRVLTEFAGHLRSHLREKDSVARLGGEEFLLILQDVTRLEVEQIVEESVKRIDTAAFYENITVTASMGAVHVSTGECTSDELLRHADSLLYEAKRQGRNQFQISEFGAIRAADGSGRVTEMEHRA